MHKPEYLLFCDTSRLPNPGPKLNQVLITKNLSSSESSKPESENKRKQKDRQILGKKVGNMKVTVISIVVGTLRMTPKSLQKRREQ